MQYIGDAILILILVLAGFIGYKRGFLGLVLHFLAGVVTIVVASLLCKPLGVAIGNLGLSGVLADSFGKVFSVDNALFTTPIKGITAEQISAAISSINVPDFLSVALANLIKEAAAATSVAADATVMSVVIDALVSMALTAIAWLILFVVLTVIFAILKRFIKVFDKIPLVGPANKWLGCILCEVITVAIIFILMYLFIMVATALPASVVAYVDNSILLGLVYEYNPLALILTKIFM